ncbi:MAG TPA: hypothetical protein PKO45_15760 [Rubrivivax sp.]|nr:hypothetical protein [Rubrivivax sp.]
MEEEFDDATLPLPAWAATSSSADAAAPRRRRIARVVRRLYEHAPPPLRQRMLQRLLAPLSTLAVAGVAAGAFGRWLYRGGAEGLPLAELDRLSGEPMIELASFVEQVSPQALEDFARFLAEQPLGLAAFSVGAAWLLLRLLRERRNASERPAA